MLQVARYGLGLIPTNVVKNEVEVEALEPQNFKGKAEPVPVYRALKTASAG